MFVRKISVEYQAPAGRAKCPVAWIDNFSMRNFTNDSIFDDTLPIGDGLLAIGKRVPLDRLKAAMEDWFRRKGYLAKGAELSVTELIPAAAAPAEADAG